MPIPVMLLAFAGVVIVFCGGRAFAAESEFPPIRSGLWEMHAVRVLPSGKSQKWTMQTRYCQDASLAFQGYWGLGILNKAGCRFESSKLSDNRYRVTSECMVRRAGKATSEGTVTLTGDDAFELEMDVQEGKRHYHATERGRRLGDCSPSDGYRATTDRQSPQPSPQIQSSLPSPMSVSAARSPASPLLESK